MTKLSGVVTITQTEAESFIKFFDINSKANRFEIVPGDYTSNGVAKFVAIYDAGYVTVHVHDDDENTQMKRNDCYE